jgi:DNA polymerase elongation subunit (family B)
VKTIALNIETAANPALLEALPELDVKVGNTKDPAKIAEKKEEARLKQLSHMALDPFLGQVLCVSLATRKLSADGQTSNLKVATAIAIDHSEPSLLEWTWKHLAGKPDEPVQVVTFNGVGFDLSFLQIRSLCQHIDCAHVECNKYKVQDPNGSHCDLMVLLHELHNSVRTTPRTLSFYVAELLHEPWPHKDIDQTQLGTLLKTEGGPETIKALCEWNVTRTLMLHELIRRHLT